jgi:protein gp37
MADKTGIEWTDATWNPVRGCSRVSEGCRNCYAERVAARFSGPGQPYEGLAKRVGGEARWTGKVRLIESALELPLRWRKPRRIFVNSMSDLFHEEIPDEWIDRSLAVMALCPKHKFQVLTKRPERMHVYIAGAIDRVCNAIEHLRTDTIPVGPTPHGEPGSRWWPLPNLWLGVSVEDQATADGRIPNLLDTPAALRFVSCEPLLGPIDLTDSCNGFHFSDFLRGRRWHDGPPAGTIRTEEQGGTRLDWVIAGGESGPGARPCHPAWIRRLRNQCEAAGVPFFFKQWGAWAPVPQREDLPGKPKMIRAGDMFVAPAGDRHEVGADLSSRLEATGTPMRRVGKKAAGAMLDGREHREFPR